MVVATPDPSLTLFSRDVIILLFWVIILEPIKILSCEITLYG